MSSERIVGGLTIDDVTASQFLKSDANKKVVSVATINAATDLSGTVPVANGGTGVTTFGGINTILYTTSADTLVSLPTANNSVFTTSATGAPQLTQTAPLTAIIDEFSSNNEIVTFTDVASAVNEVDVSNAATGDGPIISATGDDANIDLNVNAKGTGNVTLSGISYPNADGTSGQALVTDGSGVLSFVTIDTPITNSFNIAAGGSDLSTVIATTTDSAICINITVIGRLTSGANSGDAICIKIKAAYKNKAGTVTRVGSIDDYLINKDSTITRTAGVNMDALTSVSGTNVVVSVFGDATDTSSFSVLLNALAS